MRETSFSGKQTVEEFVELAIIKERHRLLILLWGALFSLVVADGLITEFLIAEGFAWELNPFLADLIGGSKFLILKILGAILAILILRDVSRKHHRIALAATCFFLFIYTLIVFWNIGVFLLGL